ncbi:sex pilus assembly, partial [mine drainage metagenome]
SPQYALDALMAYRNLTDSGSYCSSGTPAMCEWAKTFESYVADCALPEYKLQGRWWNGDPNAAANLLAAIQVNSLGFITDDYLGTKPGTTSTGQVSSCANTYQDLSSAWNNAHDGIATGFAGLLKINLAPGETPAAALQDAYSTLQANDGVGTAAAPSAANLTAQLGEAGANAQQSVQNAVSANLLARGLAKGYRDANQAGEAAIIESAANQRNIQFAAQSSLFTRTLRATMTFFEGVIYGMAPFLAFLIPLGPMGFRYVGRYLQVLVWIFLWMPLLSFVNLFEIMAVLREMNALSPAIGNLPLISAVGINQIEYTVSDWIGIGGYLATAAIGFSGFVVFGAVAAFQGIAAEANAPTSLNPGPLAPDMMNVAPPVSIGGVYQAQAGSALAMAGASNLVFSGSQQIALTKQHALNDVLTQAAALKAEGGFSKQVNLQNAQAWADHYRLTHDQHGGAGMNASAPQGARHTQNTAASQSSSTTVGGHLGGNASIAGVGLGGAQIGHTSDWRNTTSQDAQASQGKDFTPNANYNDTRGNDSSLGKDQTTTEQGGTSHSATIGRTESRLYNAVQTYNEAAQASQSVGAGMQVSLPQAAAFLGGNAAALSTAERAANGFSSG